MYFEITVIAITGDMFVKKMFIKNYTKTLC